MVEVRQGTLGGGYSRLRSGREHWAWMVMVEVRQGTLTWMVVVEVRQRNTVDRGSQLDEEDEEDDEEEDDEEEEKEEERREEKEEDEDEEDEEEATDIKSNNPHLAGGEKASKL